MPGKEESRSGYPETPEGRAKLWEKEFAAAEEWLRDWREDAEKLFGIFLDEKVKDDQSSTHLNFYWANTRVLLAMLYGKTPRISVARRHADPNDQLARVGALILERALNTDVERYDDGYRDALGYTLIDFLIPGYGCSRVRYWAEFEDQTKPAVGEPGTPRHAPEVTRRTKTSEEVCTDYVYWGDQRWSPCRTHTDKRWHAFAAPMTRDDLHRRFDGASLTPQEVDSLPLSGSLFGKEKEKGVPGDDPWARAEVWEVWDKQRGEVVWFVRGYPKVLDVKKDPLELTGFWPFPRPLMANLTTQKLIPRPDYAMARDLYDDINLLATRVADLEEALRVAGVYDAGIAGSGISKLLDQNTRNELIPVQGYPALREKGGLEGIISWLPIAQVADALDKTKEQLADKQRLLYEITGWSDVMRGQVQDPAQLATNTRAAVRYGSVRVQAIQDEFARYASDLQRLRAEVMVKLFDDQAILARSNIMQTADRDVAPQALRMLRQDFAKYVIEVKPENVALTDFAATKAERTEFLTAFTSMMQSGGQLVAALGPQGTAVVMPLMVEVVKWTLAGYRGGASVEGVLDKLLAQVQGLAQQAAQAPPQQAQDPRAAGQAQAAQARLQADLQRIEAKKQADLQAQASEVQAAAARQQQQLEANVQEERMKADIKVQAAQGQAAARRSRGLP